MVMNMIMSITDGFDAPNFHRLTDLDLLRFHDQTYWMEKSANFVLNLMDMIIP